MKTTDFVVRRAEDIARNVRGFTILELTIAAALVAITAGIAAPGMLDLIRSNRLSTAARELDADILLARREAIERKARVLVCVAGSTAGSCGTGAVWARGWLVCYDANQDNECDASTSTHRNPIRQHAELDPTLTLTGPAAVARFNANGTQGAAGASTLTFTARGAWTGSKTYVETVTPTGNVSLTAGS
jgi:type IV fimbrial biogenesis protein FimT